MKMNIHDFKTLINNFCANVAVLDDIYVVFKAAYTENELEKEKYQLELLEFEADISDYVWLNDWNEGQEYIEFFGIYTESDILALILSKSNFKISDIEE